MNLKKRLIIATDSFLPRWDGIARFLEDILPSLTHDFDVTVIAPDFPGNYPNIHKINIVRIPLITGLKVGDFTIAQFRHSNITETVKDGDILWTQTTGTIATAAIKIAKEHKIKHVAYMHSIDWLLVKRALGNKHIINSIAEMYAKHHVTKILRNANLIMVPSHEVQEIVRWYGIQSKVSVIPLGVDTTKFVPAISKREAKKDIGLDVNSPVVGYVGRIGYEKDIHTLFLAYKRLKQEFANVTLLIVGEGVLDIKKELSSDPGVRLIGSQDNVVPYLQAMDMHVLPSLLETTSLVTLEAMSCQIPIISTPVGLVKEYIKEKENGLLFPQRNSLVLSLKMKWILENPKKAQILARNGRDTVALDHEWSQTVDKILSVLKQF